MNGKKLACVVLMLIVGIAAYFGQIVHQKADAKRSEASAAADEASKAKGEFETAQIATEKYRYESDDLRRFLQAWTQHIDHMQTQSEVEETIQASLRNANLLVLSQKFEVRLNSTGGITPKTVRASLVLEDDYAKTINWMGELERRLPIARIMSCRVTGGDSGRHVHAEISLEVPLMNLSYEQIAPNAKKA